jgi:hypothetical protein
MSLTPTFNGSSRDRAAAIAQLQENKIHPPTDIISFSADYSVPLVSPAWVAYSGSLSRTCIKFDAASSGLGQSVEQVTFRYRTTGNPVAGSKVSVGIRKESDDSFILIAEHPIENTLGQIRTAVVGGENDYVMVEDDRLSIEFAPSANSIESATSTTESLPIGFTSQSYDGSYSDTTNPLAVRIKTKLVTPI